MQSLDHFGWLFPLSESYDSILYVDLNQSLEYTEFSLKPGILFVQDLKPWKALVHLKPRGQFAFQNMLFHGSHSGFNDVLTCYMHPCILTNNILRTPVYFNFKKLTSRELYSSKQSISFYSVKLSFRSIKVIWCKQGDTSFLLFL